MCNLAKSFPIPRPPVPRFLLAGSGAGCWDGRESWDTKGRSEIASGSRAVKQQLAPIGQSLRVLLGELRSGSLRCANSPFV